MRTLTLAVTALLVPTATAMAGSHLWVINELFSNHDGTIQFVEMKESMGAANEIFIGGKWVESDATGTQFVFPADLDPGTTANQHLLLATAGFAALPGAPTPDYIIPDGFFDLGSDTIRYWTYPNSPLTFGSGQLSLGGQLSWNRDDGVAINTPTNFNEETGSVEARCTPADTDFDLRVNVNDLVNVIKAWGTADPDADINDTGEVDVDDLVAVISEWGNC